MLCPAVVDYLCQHDCDVYSVKETHDRDVYSVTEYGFYYKLL
jgi:hypothetical protein